MKKKKTKKYREFVSNSKNFVSYSEKNVVQVSKDVFAYSDMISMTTALRLLGIDRKTLKRWVKRLKIKTHPDAYDKRKLLLSTNDLKKIKEQINPNKRREYKDNNVNRPEWLMPYHTTSKKIF